jgi:hypothetical protein
VADGGNQTRVAVGSGVFVGMTGVDVAIHTSIAEQEVIHVIARSDAKTVRRSKEHARNDIMKVQKFMNIL